MPQNVSPFRRRHLPENEAAMDSRGAAVRFSYQGNLQRFSPDSGRTLPLMGGSAQQLQWVAAKLPTDDEHGIVASEILGRCRPAEAVSSIPRSYGSS